MAQTQVSKYLTFCCNLTCSANSTKYYCCDRKSRVVCAQSFAPWQQATIEIMLAISLCVRLSLRSIDHTLISAELPHRNLSYYCLLALHMWWCYSSHTSRSWWITQSTQHHRRGCNRTKQIIKFLAVWKRPNIEFASAFTKVSHGRRIAHASIR